MKLIGLSGPAGVGKDSVADYLVENHGFTKFSFSDALYAEVAAAFGIDVKVLYARDTKEKDMEALQYFYCNDHAFKNVMFEQARALGVKYPTDKWFSPRQVLQWWGTEYRRKQDPQYWIKRAELTLQAYLELAVEDPKTPRAGLVNSSVRFPNEVEFIRKWNGEVWHLTRPGYEMQAAAAAHVAEQGLPVEPGDKVIHNRGTVEQLGTAASLLLVSRPGVQIKTGPVVEFVTCKGCGWVHKAYSRAEAQVEVDRFNEWFKQQDEKTRESFGNRESTIESYEGCDRCGKNDFRQTEPGDCPDGCTIGPVIYEQ